MAQVYINVPPSQQLAAFLDKLPFQQYVSLTYRSPRSLGLADATCKLWLETLERHHRSPIGAVTSIESVNGGHTHHHLLLLSTAPLDIEFEKTTWFFLSRASSRHSIEIQPYDPSRGALSYVIKTYGSPQDEVELRSLEIFASHDQTFWKRNARQRRRYRRLFAKLQASPP